MKMISEDSKSWAPEEPFDSGRTGNMPLDLGAYEPNEESLRSIAETEEIFAKGGGRRFKTTDELFASLKA